ncbi:MAG: TrkA C-terminal domain-containing protein, partial [Deltaproteobacteria bacterium]
LEKTLMDTFYVDGACSVAGKTLSELDLRKKTGASIIAVIRRGEAKSNPTASFIIEDGDILVVLGSHAQLNGAIELLNRSCHLPEA